MLEVLLQSLTECNLNKSLINNVVIIIVDNDIERTAEGIVLKLKESYNGTILIEYSNYAVKGLSNVRNELLHRAFLFKPDFIAFIDDDEYVSPQWLNELVKTLFDNSGDMVVGPVISVFDSNIPVSLTCWFERKKFNNNARIYFIATNNLLIRTELLLKNNIWFDVRFNRTGAEDSYFGQQLLNNGAAIYWAANAVVYETVSENRISINWLIKRYFNGANTYTFILKIEKKYSELLRKTLISMFYIIAGIFALLLVVFPIKRKYWGIIKLAEGTGGFAGLLSIKYYEYK
jgi:succinoglycan biosynthesis protein ExoM